MQLANPKAAVFMFAFYPQFVSPGGHMLAQTAVLAFLQVLVETALYLGLAARGGPGLGLVPATGGTSLARPDQRRRAGRPRPAGRRHVPLSSTRG